MYGFQYHRPTSVRQAAHLLRSVPDPKLIAGGQTLLPTMKLRLAAPETIIDLAKVEGLTGIHLEGRSLTIGAMTRHADVAASAIVRGALPALAGLAGSIGDPHVRNQGTLGGSVANNDPAADYPAAVLALDATIVTNHRRINADTFFAGLFETVLEPDEIITKIVFPVPRRAGYAKFSNPASRYAIVGVFVARFSTGIRVAVTGAGASGVFRPAAIEQALARRFSPKSLDGVRLSSGSLNDDIHASAEYRAHLVNVMARRAVEAAQDSGQDAAPA
ncbi:FAD binding domain-containing protein [Blastochloris viridis]|nr:xanthine dehydrogenase family protein subunit M [Blastochloris viridis]BAS00077.1 carbon monoxide dehydrogenase medium chain [Blastochloris viridis]